MENRIGRRVQEKLFTLYLNDKDEYIQINVNDAAVFDRFADFLSWLDKKTEDITAKEKAFQEKYGAVIREGSDGNIDINTDAFIELSKMRSSTYRETEERIDMIFGAGTCKKYFRSLYEISPDFVPDDECFFDFLEEITPVLNNLFADRRKRIELKYSKNRNGGKKNRYRTKNQLITAYTGN